MVTSWSSATKGPDADRLSRLYDLYEERLKGHVGRDVHVRFGFGEYCATEPFSGRLIGIVDRFDSCPHALLLEGIGIFGLENMATVTVEEVSQGHVDLEGRNTLYVNVPEYEECGRRKELLEAA